MRQCGKSPQFGQYSGLNRHKKSGIRQGMDLPRKGQDRDRTRTVRDRTKMGLDPPLLGRNRIGTEPD